MPKRYNVSNRYQATERKMLSPKETCRACEGMGFCPRKRPNDPAADEIGYVFLRCDKCGGTGRRDGKGEAISDRKIQADVAKIKRAISG